MAYERYYPGGWKNKPNSNTYLHQDALNHMEDGIEVAHEAIDGRLSDANLNATYVRTVNGQAVGPDGNVTVEGGGAIGADVAAIAKMDMRAQSTVEVCAAGDSTLDIASEWYAMAWKELLAELWPERPVDYIEWDKTADTQKATVAWQTGPSGGGGTGSKTIGQDSFTRTGALAGSNPAVGASGWSSAGGFETDGSKLIRSAGASGLSSAYFTLAARDDPSKPDGKWAGSVTLPTNTGVGANTSLMGPSINSSNYLRLHVSISAAGVASAVLRKTIGGTNTAVATFPVGTLPDNAAGTAVPFEIMLAGTTVTAKLNGQTVTGTLTASDVTALTGTQRFEFSTDLAGFAMDDVLVTETIATSGGGSTLPAVPKVTVRNGAASGERIGYQLARLSRMYPTRPDLFFICHGHNHPIAQTPEEFVTEVQGFVDQLHALHGNVPIVIVSQNPRFSTNISEHEQKQRAIRAHAAAKGWGYIGTYEALRALPDGGQSKIAGDGIHPTQTADPSVQTGARFQADVVKKWVKSRSARGTL